MLTAEGVPERVRHRGVVTPRRVVVLGRGGAGKSTLARRLGAATGLPVVELDRHFWRADLAPTPRAEWAAAQRRLTAAGDWILDGDLGPHDALEVRVAAADTVVVLDFPLWRCAWRAARRSRENLAFWRWLVGYRRRSLPAVLATVARHAPSAELHVPRTPREVDRFLSHATPDRTQRGATMPTPEDRTEIGDAIVRYTRAVDTGDWDRLDTVFTEDAHLDYTAIGGIAGGYPEVKRWLAASVPQFPRRMHLLGQLDITVTGDTAAATAYFYNPMAMPVDGAADHVVECAGFYHHEFVRTAHGWRSRRQVQEIVFARGL